MVDEAGDFYNAMLDTSFDAAFASMALPWLPWVGCAFRQSQCRTIILGESIYDYGKGEELVRARIMDGESLRRRHMQHGVLNKFSSAYVRNFERSVFLKRRPCGKQRERLWTNVVYHNLVMRMLASPKNRPTFNDYSVGWEKLLELATVVQAQRCIVYGLEPLKINALIQVLNVPDTPRQFSRQRLRAVGHNRPCKLEVTLDDRKIDFLFIRHPSSFFSWKQWGLALREHNMLPLLLD